MSENKTENKTSEAIRNISTAMLFFLIDVNILGFDVVPDFVGWLSLIGAVDLLTGKVKGIERIRTFGCVMLWYELAMVVLNYIGHLVPFYDVLSSYLGIFIPCIRIYFMYIILTAAAEIGAAEGGEAQTLKKLCRSRNWVVLSELGVYLVAAVQGAEEVGGIIWVPFVVYFISCIGCILRLICLKEEIEIWEKENLEIQEIAE